MQTRCLSSLFMTISEQTLFKACAGKGRAKATKQQYEEVWGAIDAWITDVFSRMKVRPQRDSQAWTSACLPRPVPAIPP